MTDNSWVDLPYIKWLENALQELIKFPVKGLCMYAVAEDGAIYSNYHNVSMMDKISIAGLIQQDAMMDSMAAAGIITIDDGEQEED